MTTEKERYLHVLEQVPIFAALEKDKILNLYNKCEIRHLKTDEYLIHEGTEAEEIYVVLDGEVSVVLKPKGEPFEVARFGPGGCLGETSVIGIQKHSADVIVLKDSTFLILTRVRLMELYNEDVSLFAMLVLNIARELARRLKETDRYIETGGSS